MVEQLPTLCRGHAQFCKLGHLAFARHFTYPGHFSTRCPGQRLVHERLGNARVHLGAKPNFLCATSTMSMERLAICDGEVQALFPVLEFRGSY